MSVEFNHENRNFNLQSRSCSFCRKVGHNITTCDSEPIRNFRRNTLNFIQSRSEEPRQLGSSFLDYLLNQALYAPNVVRAFAIRYCGSNTRSNMDRCIELIIQYFTSHIQNVETNNQSIWEIQPAEESQIVEPEQTEPISHLDLRQFRRNEFSELDLDYLEMEYRNYDRNYDINLYEMTVFMNIITTINEGSALLNTKFNIKTKISEKKDDLHEKCECNICYEEHEKEKFIKLDCGHEFCKDCIIQSLQNEIRKIPCCAFCRADIKNFEIKNESIKIEFDEFISNEIES